MASDRKRASKWFVVEPGYVIKKVDGLSAVPEPTARLLWVTVKKGDEYFGVGLTPDSAREFAQTLTAAADEIDRKSN